VETETPLSNIDDYDDNEETETDESGLTPAERRKLQKELKQLRESQAATAAAARKAAFYEAGINPKDPKAKYFINGYDGELDPEAIKAAAIEAGFLEAETQVSQEERAAHERVAAASTGASPDSAVRGSEEEVIARLQNAQSQEEVLDIYRQAGGQVTSGGLAPNQAPLQVVTTPSTQS
jgi:hypothetical protein